MTKFHKLLGVTLLSSAFTLGYLAHRARAAGIPSTSTLTYSGALTDNAGAPVTGTKNIQVELVDAASAGNILCSVGPSAIALDQGSFQVTLPDTCTTAVHGNPNVWLDVLVDGSSLGRSKLGAVPYAVEADTAARAASASGVLATTLTTLQTSLSTLQALVACPTGYYQAGPHVCIESGTLHPADTAWNAIQACMNATAHVCSENEMEQACGAAAAGLNSIPTTFNPFGGAAAGWFSDNPADDVFMTWNSSTCNPNPNGPATAATAIMQYRCCK